MSAAGVKREGEEVEEMEEKSKKPKKSQAVVSSCVLVTVDYQDQALREKVKGLGATWCKPLSGWVLPESARAAVMAVVSGGEPSADDLKTLDKAAQSEDPPASQNAGAKLCIAPHKKAIVVTGDTMKVKDTLKKLQGSWNKGLGGRCCPVHLLQKSPVPALCLDRLSCNLDFRGVVLFCEQSYVDEKWPCLKVF